MTRMSVRAWSIVQRAVRREEKARQECTRDSERCRSATNPAIPTRDCCRRWNALILKDVAEMLDRVGARWWIDYGTLLGYMVNGGLYWNDKDTDLGMLAEDREKVLAQKPALERLGYMVTYTQPRPTRFGGGDRMKVRLSTRNHTNCDLFFWEPGGSEMIDRRNYIRVDRHKGREFPPEWALPTKRGHWEGVEVAVPAEAEQLVAHRYGDKWRDLPAARTDGMPR